MRLIVTILLVLMIAATAMAADSEIAIFDEGQSALSRFEDKEIAAWKQIDPQTAEFHEKWKKLNELSRKRNRLVFLYKLQHKPDSIHWDSWKGWLRPIESSAEAETFKDKIPGYADITADFERQKKLLTSRSDLLERRTTLYRKNKDTFKKLEDALSEELSALQKRMDAVRKSHASQNSVPTPSTR